MLLLPQFPTAKAEQRSLLRPQTAKLSSTQRRFSQQQAETPKPQHSDWTRQV